MEQKQAITIKASNNHFVVLHERDGFGLESYSARSSKGVVNIVGNILIGFKPDPTDVYLEEPVNANCKYWKKPRPLD